MTVEVAPKQSSFVAGERQAFSLPDAELVLYRNFFTPVESEALFAELLTAIEWGQGQVKIFGRLLAEPRLTAWYGDAGKSYSYSGLTLAPLPWTPVLVRIKQRVDEAASARFNSVLLNLYRDGKDGVGWHQDDEPELGRNPVIASVSFGATRRFQMRHRRRKDTPPVELDLEHGSLLVMSGTTQHCWRHQAPKTARPVGARINLTFRVIL